MQVDVAACAGVHRAAGGRVDFQRVRARADGAACAERDVLRADLGAVALGDGVEDGAGRSVERHVAGRREHAFDQHVAARFADRHIVHGARAQGGARAQVDQQCLARRADGAAARFDDQVAAADVDDAGRRAVSIDAALALDADFTGSPERVGNDHLAQVQRQRGAARADVGRAAGMHIDGAGGIDIDVVALLDDDGRDGLAHGGQVVHLGRDDDGDARFRGQRVALHQRDRGGVERGDGVPGAALAVVQVAAAELELHAHAQAVGQPVAAVGAHDRRRAAGARAERDLRHGQVGAVRIGGDRRDRDCLARLGHQLRTGGQGDGGGGDVLDLVHLAAFGGVGADAVDLDMHAGHQAVGEPAAGRARDGVAARIAGAGVGEVDDGGDRLARQVRHVDAVGRGKGELLRIGQHQLPVGGHGNRHGRAVAADGGAGVDRDVMADEVRLFQVDLGIGDRLEQAGAHRIEQFGGGPFFDAGRDRGQFLLLGDGQGVTLVVTVTERAVGGVQRVILGRHLVFERGDGGGVVTERAGVVVGLGRIQVHPERRVVCARVLLLVTVGPVGAVFGRLLLRIGVGGGADLGVRARAHQFQVFPHAGHQVGFGALVALLGRIGVDGAAVGHLDMDVAVVLVGGDAPHAQVAGIGLHCLDGGAEGAFVDVNVAYRLRIDPVGQVGAGKQRQRLRRRADAGAGRQAHRTALMVGAADDALPGCGHDAALRRQHDGVVGPRRHGADGQVAHHFVDLQRAAGMRAQARMRCHNGPFAGIGVVLRAQVHLGLGAGVSVHGAGHAAAAVAIGHQHGLALEIGRFVGGLVVESRPGGKRPPGGVGIVLAVQVERLRRTLPRIDGAGHAAAVVVGRELDRVQVLQLRGHGGGAEIVGRRGRQVGMQADPHDGAVGGAFQADVGAGIEHDGLAADVGAVAQLLDRGRRRQRGGAGRVDDGAGQQNAGGRVDRHVAGGSAEEVDVDRVVGLDAVRFVCGIADFAQERGIHGFLAPPGLAGVLVDQLVAGIGVLHRFPRIQVGLADIGRGGVDAVKGGVADHLLIQDLFAVTIQVARIGRKCVDAGPRAALGFLGVPADGLGRDGPVVALAGLGNVVGNRIGRIHAALAGIADDRYHVAGFFVQRGGEAAVAGYPGMVDDQQLPGALLRHVEAVEHQIVSGLVVDGDRGVAAEHPHFAVAGAGDMPVELDVAAAGAQLVDDDALVDGIPLHGEQFARRRGQPDQARGARRDIVDLGLGRRADGQLVSVVAALDHAIEVDVVCADVDAVALQRHDGRRGRLEQRGNRGRNAGPGHARAAGRAVGTARQRGHAGPLADLFAAHRIRCHAVDIHIAVGGDGHVPGVHRGADVDVALAAIDGQVQRSGQVVDGACNRDVRCRVGGAVGVDVGQRIEIVGDGDGRRAAGARLRDCAEMGRGRRGAVDLFVLRVEQGVRVCAHAVERDAAIAVGDGDAVEDQVGRRVVDDRHRGVGRRVERAAAGDGVGAQVDGAGFGPDPVDRHGQHVGAHGNAALRVDQALGRQQPFEPHHFAGIEIDQEMVAGWCEQVQLRLRRRQLLDQVRLQGAQRHGVGDARRLGAGVHGRHGAVFGRRDGGAVGRRGRRGRCAPAVEHQGLAAQDTGAHGAVDGDGAVRVGMHVAAGAGRAAQGAGHRTGPAGALGDALHAGQADALGMQQRVAPGFEGGAGGDVDGVGLVQFGVGRHGVDWNGAAGERIGIGLDGVLVALEIGVGAGRNEQVAGRAHECIRGHGHRVDRTHDHAGRAHRHGGNAIGFDGNDGREGTLAAPRQHHLAGAGQGSPGADGDRRGVMGGVDGRRCAGAGQGAAAGEADAVVDDDVVE